MLGEPARATHIFQVEIRHMFAKYPFGPTHETTEERFDRVFSTYAKAPYSLVAEVAPLMAKRGKGVIVNLSTIVADCGAPRG
jgi:NAD(P)-dependent dehydrogenase (short-subunit alcohol dehydrogenase family)